MAPMKNSSMPPATTSLQLEQQILPIRDQKVMLDRDLANLYGVPVKALLQAVKRNLGRFPEDFMFQLDTDEWATLRSQTVTSNVTRGGRRYAPYAFTEQGVAMLSSVLSSAQAIAVNIEIMRTFARLREVTISYKELARRIDNLEHHAHIELMQKQAFEHDTRGKIEQIFLVLRELMKPPEPVKKRPIGFITPDEPPKKT